MMNKALLLIALFCVGCANLQGSTFSDEEGAIRGYDPVAYFSEGKPVKGVANITYRYKGSIWHFANEENRQRFGQDPTRYEPQYGGYCAYAMSNGYVASINPQAWTIHDDKLYLNYSLGVRERWLKDIPGHVKRADRNWTEKLRDGF